MTLAHRLVLVHLAVELVAYVVLLQQAFHRFEARGFGLGFEV